MWHPHHLLPHYHPSSSLQHPLAWAPVGSTHWCGQDASGNCWASPWCAACPCAAPAGSLLPGGLWGYAPHPLHALTPQRCWCHHGLMLVWSCLGGTGQEPKPGSLCDSGHLAAPGAGGAQLSVESALPRDGFRELFEQLHQHRVPLCIFSAGVGDVVEEVLCQAGALRPNVRVVSNYMDFDEQVRAAAGCWAWEGVRAAECHRHCWVKSCPCTAFCCSAGSEGGARGWWCPPVPSCFISSPFKFPFWYHPCVQCCVLVLSEDGVKSGCRGLQMSSEAA